MTLEHNLEPYIRSLIDLQKQIVQYIEQSKFTKGDVRISVYHNSVDMIRSCLVMMNLVDAIQLGALPLQTICPLLGLKPKSGNEIRKEDAEIFLVCFCNLHDFH